MAKTLEELEAENYILRSKAEENEERFANLEELVSSQHDEIKNKNQYTVHLESTLEKLKIESLSLLKKNSTNQAVMSLFDNSKDLMYQLDNNWNITYINKASIQFGYTPEELIGINLVELLHTDDVEKARNRFLEQQAVLEQTNGEFNHDAFNDIKPLEVRIISKDGSLAYLEARSTPVSRKFSLVPSNNLFLEPNNHFEGTFGIARDITDRKYFENMAFAILDNLKYGVYLINEKREYVYANPAHLSHLESSKEEVIGKPIYDFIAEEFHEMARDKIINIFNGQNESGIVGVPGTNSKIERSGTLLEAKIDGERVYLGTDFLLDEIIKEQEYWNKTFDSAPVAIAIFKNRIIQRSNKQMSKTFGKTPDELTGMNSRELYLTTEAYEEFGKEIYPNLENDEKLTFKTNMNKINRETGEREVIDIEALVTRIGEYKGEDTEIIAAFVDETEKNKLTKEHLHSMKMESIGTLVSGISHDFNNILTVISGYCQLMELRLEKDTYEHNSLKEILKASNRAKKLTENLLGFTRPKAESKSVFYLKSPVEETVQLLQSTLPSSIEIIANTSEYIGKILADPTEIHQITMNLCVNSKDAMNEKGKLEIALEDYNKDNIDYACLSITDNGSGMDEATIKRIFDPFYTTKPTDKGTGLGLYNVHEIIKNLNGYINVESSLGVGTTIKICIPKESDKQNISPLEESLELITYGKGNVVVIDDEIDVGNLTMQMLTTLGYRTSVANNSEEFVEKYKKSPNQYDLIITDQTMPKITGTELINEVKQINPNQPIIIISGYSDRVDKSEMDKLNIPYLSKPLNLGYLSKIVKEKIKK